MKRPRPICHWRSALRAKRCSGCPLITARASATLRFDAGSTSACSMAKRAAIATAPPNAGSAMRYRLMPSARQAVTSFERESSEKVTRVVTRTAIGAMS
jgi:hypothetical protein